ncbi:activator of 90 kDa heat shock protein ATPase homolog 1-like [Schistocerca nitens]|uniref:activator of 90 kDa heat shock protein ATPase homolog 1-like n=1 Tax=Schistocerca nitens TaxID=7011 RepID=UPI002118F658|nr:activator of 90 kDa heat shock protein ATPase homolog 1-like [Schistocerca nitens]
MAKWGEGDTRWIVEQRADATNVNNWHWTEKNARQWSINKLQELLTGLKIENALAACSITEVDRCEGDAVANNRKGKLLFFYEWELILKWEGHLRDADHVKIEGTAIISNFNEEQEASEINVDLTVSTPSPEADRLKDIIMKDARELIRLKLANYIKTLKEDFSKGMILARKSEGKSETKTTKTGDTERLSQVLFEKVPVSKSEQEVKQLRTVKTGTLTMTIKLQCTKEEFYCALTNKEMVEAFTKSGVKMDVEPGGTFELLRGNISGQFLELVPNSKIYQTWRISNWPDGHFSTVLIEIEQLLDGIEVKLTQESIPESHLDTMKDNWNRYYWDAMRGTFGFGAFLA